MANLLRHSKLLISVTRLGDLLHSGQLFKASDNNCFAQIAHILGIFCNGVKIFHFSGGIIFWATFIDIWRFFTDHTAFNLTW